MNIPSIYLFCFSIIIVSTTVNSSFGSHEQTTSIAPLQKKSLKDLEPRERRLLKKKRRRLKELREEMRILTLKLDPDVHLSTESPKIRPIKLKSGVMNERRWKKKLLEGMGRVNRRLDRLERAWERWREQNAPEKKPKKEEIQLTTIKSTIDSPIFKQMSRKTGANGSVCSGHRECKPGLCCHVTSLFSQCTLHSLPNGTACLDSCQCTPPLSCFHTKNSTDSYCKRPQGEDVISGIYVHNGTSHFN